MRTRLIPLQLATLVCLLVLFVTPATSLPFNPDEPSGGTGPGNQEDIPEYFGVQRPYVNHPSRSDSVPRGTGLVAGFYSDAENEAEALQRRDPNGVWVDIVGVGSHPNGVRHVDRNLQPDTRYCYRAVARRGNLTVNSSATCERTRSAQAEPVLRLQVMLSIADISDAGTGNGSVSADVGVGAQTWLDRPGDDFTRGSRSNFDLPPVRNMSDIEYLVIRNHNDDDMCVRSLSLEVNETQVFSEYFGDADCIWIGRDTSSVFHISGDELRASSLWIYPAATLANRLSTDTYNRGPRYSTSDREVAVLHLPADEIQERLESSIGSGLRGTGLYWGNSGSVDLSRLWDEDMSLDVDLSYDQNNWFDPSVNLQATLEFAGGVNNAGRPNLTLRMKNPRVSTDADPVFDILSEVLQCRFLWAMITHDDFKSCVDQITEWQGNDFLGASQLAQTISIASISQGGYECCADVFVVVQPDTSVDVVFVLGQPDPPVNDPAPTPTQPRPWDIDDIDPKGNGTGFPRRAGNLRSNAGSWLTPN